MKRFYPLSYAPLDDDYLYAEDEERQSNSSYNWVTDMEEDEAVERDYGDPLRLTRKSPRIAATIQG